MVMTRSPGFTEVTLAPACSTVPATSRPGTYGKTPLITGHSPDRMSRSERFTPETAARTTTSSGAGAWSGSSTGTSTSGGPYRSIWMAVRTSVGPRPGQHLAQRPGVPERLDLRHDRPALLVRVV